MADTLNINIDRLLIDGMELTSIQQQQLKDGLRNKLVELFTDRGIPSAMASYSDTGRISATPVSLTKPDIPAVQLGEQIAHSVYNGLSK